MKTALSLLGFACLLVSGALAQEIAPTPEEIRPLLVGSQVPDVKVQGVDGAWVGLREAIGDKPAVLVFYRGGWCPFCSAQLADLRNTVEPLRELGVQLFGISGDAPERLQPSEENEAPGFILLSDFELNASKAFGLAFHVSDEYVEKLAQYELDTGGNSISSEQVLPVPAVFVVSPDHVITFSYVNPNYRVRCDPDVLLAAAAAATKRP